MTYKQALLKQNIEYILILPIVLIGKAWGAFTIPPKKYTHFLFCPSADIGGSIKVNADIANCISDKKLLIIFSKKAKNNKFLPLFNIAGIDTIDLSNKIDNKLFHFVNIFYRGVLSSWINKASNPVVFGGESLYFYKVIPFVKKKTKVIELCHLNTWFNYSQAFINKINYRIFSTEKIKRDVEAQYTKNKISIKYYKRLFYIDNAIDIPPFQETKNKVLQVLYVGRSAPQKRVHLLVKIVEKAYDLNLPVHFTFVGDVNEYFNSDVKGNCTLLGEIEEQKELHSIYQKSDCLILTSAYEGLPIVVMDMMVRGKVVISTSVDAIPDYIKHMENGVLLFEKDEHKIIEEAIKAISMICNNANFKKKLGLNSHQFAKNQFSYERFNEFYKKILTCT